jgi:hypothetical protein
MPVLTSTAGHVARLRRTASRPESTTVRSNFGGRGVARAIRAVTDDDPAGQAEHQRNPADGDKHAAPAAGLSQCREWCTSQHRAEIADQHADADQGGEAVFFKPHGNQLEHGDEGDRDAKTHQRAPDQGPFQAGGKAEKEAAKAANDAAHHQNAAWPQGVGEDAGGDLHHRVNVKIGCGEDAQRGGRSLEGNGQILRNAGRRKALEKRQDEGGGGNAERKPASTLLFVGQVLHAVSRVVL